LLGRGRDAPLAVDVFEEFDAPGAEDLPAAALDPHPHLQPPPGFATGHASPSLRDATTAPVRNGTRAGPFTAFSPTVPLASVPPSRNNIFDNHTNDAPATGRTRRGVGNRSLRPHGREDRPDNRGVD